MSIICLSFFLFARGMTWSISRIVTGVSDSADQIASASMQLSESSHAVARGAAAQAVSLEETVASMEEMASMAWENANYSKEADSLMDQTLKGVKEANSAMEELDRLHGRYLQCGQGDLTD